MVTQSGLYYFLEGYAVAFFGIMAVLNLWHSDVRLRVILGGILLYWMAQHLVSLVFTSDFLSATRDWSPVINAFDMTAEPTCCFLLMELCRPGWLTWRKVLLHELPFVVLGGIYVATGNMLWYWILTAFFVVYGCGVFVAILYFLPRYNRFLREHYSYEENVNLIWVYYVLATFFALMFVYAACSSYDTVVGDCIYSAGSIISWAMICWFISRQESVLFELEASRREENVLTVSVDETDGDAVAQQLDLSEQIRRHFLEPEVFLRADLKLGDMAEIIGTNRTYLSRYLNDVLNTTFYDYVNAQRLAYATDLIVNSDTGIQAIAVISGFNSYSTFRRVFIAKYGMSPQEYRSKKAQS